MTEAPPAPLGRVFLDACVLFPPMVRALVLGAAEAGLFRPLWSARVLEEWRIAVARTHTAEAEAAVLTARTRMAAAFPDAEVPADPDREARIVLPDPADAHLVAAAAGRAETILTFNLRDFPARALAGYGLAARHPDGFLWEALGHESAAMRAVVADTLGAFGVAPESARSALKRARLSRLAKALAETPT